MRSVSRTVALIGVALVASCAAAQGNPPGPRATSLVPEPPAFSDPQVLVATSMPPQFEVVLTREMPTPGFTFAVDSLEVDEQAGRIVARISEVRPQGITTQVITSTPCRLPLGTLAPGRYALEIRLRRGTTGPHVLSQALVLVAR
jgi:hypothetical protein